MRGKRILTKYRKKELEYFCLQYGDYKKELANINYAKGTSEWDDPTYEEVIYRERLQKNIEVIDETMHQVCSDILCPYMYRCICKGEKYEYLEIPCGRRQFYDLRDEFYIVLSQKKHMF